MLNGVQLEQVRKLKYLGKFLNERGLGVTDVNNKPVKGRVVATTLRMLVNKRKLSVKSATALYEGVLISTILYEVRLIWKRR